MQAHISFYTVAAAALLLLLQPAVAMHSRQCIQTALDTSNWRANGGCPHSSCGPLDIPSSKESSSFLKRLSPQCQDVMLQYRRTDLQTPLGLQLGVNAGEVGRSMKKGSAGPCPHYRGATTATNPVVVEAPGVHSFVICTVPKSGCTNLRKLMHAVINGPQKTHYNAVKASGSPHQQHYSTLWHYDIAPIPADIYPTFIVGRNPYIRLLSGFLDKMIANKHRIDHTSGKLMNEDLGLHSSHFWESNVENFHKFVHRLADRGTRAINIHFAPQLSACTKSTAAVQFEYYLRIEDLAQWFPCWDQGLGLTEFTKQGWAMLPQGKVYFGTNDTYSEQSGSNLGCWWHPPGSLGCDEFYSETHTATHTEEHAGEASDVTAVPWKEKVAVSEVTKSDGHDTSAAKKWTKFYSQEIADMVYELFENDFKAFGYEKATF